jgi:ribose-phosphate pyrophosphokinase
VKTVVATIRESQIASELAQILKLDLVKVKIGKFFDTETYVDFQNPESIKNSTIIFVHQFLSPKVEQSIDEQLIEFLLAVDSIKQATPKKIIAILPYLPYSRQDKNFHGDGIGPINFWGRVFKCAGIDQIISVDLHEPNISSTFETKLSEISLCNFWADFLKNEFAHQISEKNIIIASPDRGGIERASAIAACLSLPMIAIEKIRIAPDKPITVRLDGQANCKNAVIIDDIIDTGKTAIQACNLLKQNGVEKVFGIFTHPTASQTLKNSDIYECFEKIIVTDSVILEDIPQNPKICQVSINDFLIQKIKALIN